DGDRDSAVRSRRNMAASGRSPLYDWAKPRDYPPDLLRLSGQRRSASSSEVTAAGELLVHVVRRNDARGLQLDRVDGIAGCDEQRLAIGPAERLVRGTDLPLGLAAVDWQVDRTEQLALGRRDADDARACAASGGDVARGVRLLAVTDADALRKQGKRAEGAVGIDGIPPHLTVGRGQIHPLAVGRERDAVRHAA